MPKRPRKLNARGKTTLPNTAGRKKAQAKYNSKPEQKKNRAARGRARYALMKKGLVRKGDGKDVDHRMPLSRGGSNDTSNLRVESASSNRSRNYR